MKIVLRLPGTGLRGMLVQALFYFALLCLLASLATAPGQIYLGKLYYAKDAGVVLCFATFTWLATSRGDRMSMLMSAGAGLLMMIFLPALLLGRDESASTALVIMWIMKWTVVAHLGVMIHRERLYSALRVAFGLLLSILIVDALIGFWEIRTQGYFFEMSAIDETAAGVVMVKQEHVGELIRILSIHRSGGDFGNAMAAGIIICGFVFLVVRRLWIRLLLAPLLALFAYDIFFSTVRSFLIGAVAGIVALAGYLMMPRLFKRSATPILVAVILASIFFSCFNIIPMVEFVSRHLLGDSSIGSVESSYMRLDTWDGVLRDVRATPIVSFIGGPLASALGLGAPPGNICDNIYLWIFYHTGVFGFLAFMILTPAPLAMRGQNMSRALYFAAATQLLVTGIFTDSLFYFSSLILFFALGLICAESTVFKTAPAVAPQPAPPAGNAVPQLSK